MNDQCLYVINPRRAGLSAEEYLIRQSGDWRGYVAMMDSGAIESAPFFRSMMNYYAAGIKSFENIKPEYKGILLATSVWGNDYLGRFLTLCLPSLLEEKNIAALKKRKARLFIHTDAHGQSVISNHPVISELINQDIMVQVMLLDENVLEMISAIPNAKYWHLGMTQSMHLQYAKALHVDYHLMMPDMVYSAGYFERLFDLKKSIVTHGCISSYEGDMPFDDYRKGLTLSIPPKQLMTLALLHAHLRADQHFVRQNKKLPKSHLLILEGKNEVHIMSPHQSIAYMARRIVTNIPDRIFFTLDSELEKIVGDEPIYTPCTEDALVMSEVSGKVDAYVRGECSGVEEFCMRFRGRIPESSLYQLFFRPMSFPIDREILRDRWYMYDAEIDALKKELKENLCLVNQK